MKKIGFIGAFEKTDLLLGVAKLIVEVKQKVLIVDSTINERARYIVPSITPSSSYITEYEGIDVAVGFENMETIMSYLGTSTLPYDIALIDVDEPEDFNNFGLVDADKNFFVTAFDNYSLKKGLEVIKELPNKLAMTKILFSRDMTREEDEYLNFLSYYFPVIWDKEKIYFPYDNGDTTILIEHQMASRVKYKDLSQAYRDSLVLVIMSIDPTIKNADIKNILRKI